MTLNEIRAAGCDDGPNENCVSIAPASSKKPAEKQSRTIPPLPDPCTGISVAEWADSLVAAGLFQAVQVVEGDGLGPIAAIGSPRVCVGFGDGWTMVWIERLPWGWSDPHKMFLSPMSKAAVRYALALAERVRNAAQREQDRRDRAKNAAAAELAARLNGGAL